MGSISCVGRSAAFVSRQKVNSNFSKLLGVGVHSWQHLFEVFSEPEDRQKDSQLITDPVLTQTGSARSIEFVTFKDVHFAGLIGGVVR